MTDIRRAIERLRKLDAEATQGPWSSDTEFCVSKQYAHLHGAEIDSDGFLPVENADLIAFTRNQISLALDAFSWLADNLKRLPVTEQLILGGKLQAWAENVCEDTAVLKLGGHAGNCNVQRPDAGCCNCKPNEEKKK